jgi:hypothetical protein
MAHLPRAHEHDGIRFKEIAMHKPLSVCAAWLRAQLPAGLASWCVPGCSKPGCRRARAADPLASPCVEETCTWGCGWFDSSHELVHGLQVQENSAEAANALPLATWLDLELRVCSSAPQAA